MELLKKLFNFSDTINGTDFLIRWVAANILQFPGGFLLGIAIVDGNMGLLTVGIIIAAAGVALQFSTLMKRSRALFNRPNYLYFYIAYLVISIFQGFADSINEYAVIFSSIAMLGMFIYAIAQNSDTPRNEHIG